MAGSRCRTSAGQMNPLGLRYGRKREGVQGELRHPDDDVRAGHGRVGEVEELGLPLHVVGEAREGRKDRGGAGRGPATVAVTMICVMRAFGTEKPSASRICWVMRTFGSDANPSASSTSCETRAFAAEA